MFHRQSRIFMPHYRMRMVFVAPASRRRFFYSPHVAKTPARRRRYEKPALLGESNVSQFTDRMRPQKCELRWRKRQNAHVLEVAISLRIVQPISDNEFIRNLKSDVVRLDVFLDAPFRLVKQRRDLQRIRLALLQNAQQVPESEPRIQNILDHDDVEPLD